MDISVESVNGTVLTNSLLHTVPSPSIRFSWLRTQPSPPGYNRWEVHKNLPVFRSVMFSVWSLWQSTCWSSMVLKQLKRSKRTSEVQSFKYRGNCWWASAVARCFVIQHACICEAYCPPQKLEERFNCITANANPVLPLPSQQEKCWNQTHQTH